MWKLKLDAEGKVVLQDGKPVYVDESGKEIAFDAPASVATINRLTEESKGFKTRAQTAEQKLTAFEGIEDPTAAKAAIEMVKNLDEGKLLTAGKVEEIKTAAKKAAEDQVAAAVSTMTTKLAEKDKTIDTLTGTLNHHMIGGSFKGSKLIADKFAIPHDLVEARFGSNFKVEDGKVVAYDKSGNKIYSPSKPGELADFDEALDVLVGAYPHKDQILKGTNNGGSGSRENNGGGGNQKPKGNLLGNPSERLAAIGSMSPGMAELPDR